MEAERKRIEELVREKIKPLYLLRESMLPFREKICYDQICRDVAILLFLYRHGKIDDEKFDECLFELGEDYLQFVSEREEAYVQHIKKIAYELKERM
jgi:hypothetical protein